MTKKLMTVCDGCGEVRENNAPDWFLDMDGKDYCPDCDLMLEAETAPTPQTGEGK